MNANTKAHLVSVSIPGSPTSPSGGAVGGLPTRRRSSHGGLHCGGDSPPPTDLVRMPAPSGGALAEDLLIVAGLIAVQVINAVYLVALTPLLALGLRPLFLITFGSLTTAMFVLPFAIVYEKKKWPSRLTSTMMVQFVLIALGGVATFQALMLLGIKKTSPAIASAMPNIAPGIIFIIAICLRFEKVDLKCKYSRAKIAGTVVCLGGAVIMSFLQSPGVTPAAVPYEGPSTPSSSNGDWIIGCLCLLSAVLVVSCSTVLQAATMINFPAPFTLCVVTSALGSFFTAMLQVIMEGKVQIGTPTISISMITGLIFVGSMIIAVCLSFQTWAVKKKGPVLVSMFSPIQTVCSAILSAIILGQIIKMGSLLGMVCMFLGLYMVLWAKKKEGLILEDDEVEPAQSSMDVEKPLLS